MKLSATKFSLTLIDRFKLTGKIHREQDFKGASSEGIHTTGEGDCPGRAQRAFRTSQSEFLSSREASEHPDAVTLDGGITLIPGENGDRIFIHSETETSGVSERHFMPTSRKKSKQFPEIHKVTLLTDTQVDSLRVWVRKDGLVQVEEDHIDLQKPGEEARSLWLLSR